MPKLKIMILVLCIAAIGGTATWLLLPTTEVTASPGIAPANSDAGGARQQQAKEFFGGKKEYDLKGGQEMRPRW